MEPVIRDNSPAYMASQRKSGGFWHYALLFLAVAALGLGVYYFRAYGAKPALIFAGISCAGLFLFFRHSLAKKDQPIIRNQVPVSHVLELVFARGSHAGLIVQNGQPLRANESYYELAEHHGLKASRGVPPMPDTIFSDLSDKAQSAIYRLSHLEDDEAFGEEPIEILSEQGELRRYLLRVTVLGPQQYWEIIDYSYDASMDGELLSKAPIGLLSVSETGAIISTNTVFEDWVGIKDGLRSLNLKDFIEHPDGLLDSPKDANRMIRFDTRLVTQKDFATPVVLSANWSKHPSGQYIASIALHGHSSIAIAGEGREKEVRVTRAGIQSAGHSDINVPFATVDVDRSNLSKAMIIGANSVFEKLTGISDWQDVPLTDIISANSAAQDLFSIDPKNLSAEKPIDAMLKGKDGGAVSVYASFDSGNNLRRLYLVDITARKVLEDQLVQSQKMQAIGRLVAEIAHDFNNLLAAIRLYTDTLLGRHPIGDPSYPELQQINANVNRAAALVKKLLAYSRKQTIRAENLDVSETLSDMAVTLKQVLGEKARLEIKHGRDLPPIRVDKSQFDTVLMNLAVNARDAMKGQHGGIITIQSQVFTKADLDRPMLKASLEPIKSDRVVAISVTDTGTGMTDEVKNKIFEPFFTTKAQGEGTGLGLATVYGIVQQSGGHLAVDSELGIGTTFTIYLPKSDEETPSESQSQPVKVIKPKAPSDLAGHGNILFVEDEDSVRVIAAQTLRKRGYTVIEACDGEEAYEILEEGETPFDLMISDVVMPGMDGPTLLKQARPILKDTRIVFISGYAEEEFSDLLAEEPDVTFLPKPFTLVQLAEKVKQQIGEAI